MADSIMGGLFGITPEGYQAQQNQQALAQSAQLAQLDPFASARTSLIYGGRQLGGAIAGALGAEDPQLRIISARNAVMREVDPNNPESIMAGAQKLAQVDPEGANALANSAREAAFKLSQVSKNMRERQGLDPVQQIIRSGKYTPQSIAEYEKTGDITRLALVEKSDQGGLPAIAKLQSYRQSLVDQLGENHPKVKEVDQAIKAETQSKGTTINVDTRQPIEISKNKTDLAAEIEKGAFTASDRITLAQNLRSLLPKAFVGVGSDVVLQGARVAEAFGIDVKGVAPSQIVDTILNEMTVGKAGELKGALSDKDREFLKATIGTRGLSIKTLNYVADEIERRASIDRKLNTRVNEAIKSKKNLNEIDFAEERSLANKDVKKDLDRLKELRLKAGQQQ
jgi:hypothetical protein